MQLHRKQDRRTLLMEGALTTLYPPSLFAQEGTQSELGSALTPANFPQHTSRDVDEMFRKGKELGQVAIFIYQWGQEDLLSVAKAMLERSRKEGMTSVLSISPTRLEGARGELDVPNAVRMKAKRNISFRNADVHRPFIEAALDLARLKPPYLCLATEINMLAFKDIKEYLYFGEVYRKLYPEIKKVSPYSKIFVSFQWDYFHVMAKREPGKTREHAKLFGVFLPNLDIVGLTSYPSTQFAVPDSIPRDYYQKVYDYIPRAKRVAFTEVGWPSGGTEDESRQADFVRRLPELTNPVAPEFIGWSLLHDVSVPALGGELGKTGLITRAGTQKPAFAAFRNLRK